MAEDGRFLRTFGAGAVVFTVTACASDADFPNLSDPIDKGDVMAERQRLVAVPAPREAYEQKRLGADNRPTTGESLLAGLEEILQELKELEGQGLEDARDWLAARVLLTRLDQVLFKLKQLKRWYPEQLDDTGERAFQEASDLKRQWVNRLGVRPPVE